MTSRHVKDRHNAILLAFSFAFLVWAIVWVDTHGPLQTPASERQTESIPYVNTTSVVDALFMDEWMQSLGLIGEQYHKQTIDKHAFRPHRLKGYSLEEDPFSLSKVTLKPAGTGLTLKVSTPTHFTHVTFEGMVNALATAGVRDADIELLSPAVTSGRNVLAGVLPYFIQDDSDKVRAELAHEEIGWIVLLTHQYNQDINTPERLNKVFAEIKLAISPYHHQAMRSTVKQQLAIRFSRNDLLPLSPEHEERLIDFFIRYQQTGAIYDRQTTQTLERLTNR